MHLRITARSTSIVLAALIATACGGSAPPSGNGGTNLLVNGNADSATGSMDGAPVTTPGWTATGEATAVQYGTGAYPTATDPGPTDRGTNFFSGGQGDMVSTLSQTVDVSRFATAIDAGSATYVLSGWLGGYSDQSDRVAVTATFVNTAGTPVGTPVSIGPVTAVDRANTTSFLMRSATGAVPANTRSVQVVITMTRDDGSANDGYCDDISLIFNGV